MASQHNRVLFTGSVATVGRFICPVSAPDFANTGPASDYLLAFPRTAVTIRHAGQRDPIVADPTVVTIYNKGQEYERGSLSPEGDRCDWIAFGPDTVAEAVTVHGATAAGDSERLFSMQFGPSPPDVYAHCRQLTEHLERHEAVDPVVVDELAVAVLGRVLEHAYGPTCRDAAARRPTTRRRYRALVGRVRGMLATRYRDPLTVHEIARGVHASPFHLCRVFRRQTGTTIYQTLVQLRLRDALRALARTDRDVGVIGIDAGFPDHSHFAQSFRRAFGMTPGGFRQAVRSATAPVLVRSVR